jgi:hypothetical protein
VPLPEAVLFAAQEKHISPAVTKLAESLTILNALVFIRLFLRAF